MPDTTGAPNAPSHLTEESRTLWAKLLDSFALEDHERDMLRVTLEARDRANQARDLLDADGLTYVNRFGDPHVRPEVKVEHDARRLYLAGMRQLSLPEEA
jgi:hypothetical protein